MAYPEEWNNEAANVPVQELFDNVTSFRVFGRRRVSGVIANIQPLAVHRAEALKSTMKREDLVAASRNDVLDSWSGVSQ